MTKETEVVIKFYQKEISAKKFIKYLNGSEQLQKDFNKVLKNAPSNPATMTAVQWINDCYNSGSNFKMKDGRSKRDFLIWLYARDFLAKTNCAEYLKQEDVEQIILFRVLDMSMLYSAGSEVEDFIKTEIIAAMPKFKNINKAVAYAKEQAKTYFVCDDKPPRWIQNCEWPFGKDGKPMRFKTSTGNASHKFYYFYDTEGKERVIEQFD